MKNYNNIIKNIILAQVASDAGKGIYIIRDYIPPILSKEVKTAEYFGYKRKDFYIQNAIKIINTTPRCGINYWCRYALDQNGYGCMLVYFDIKSNGKRHQISFHSPYNRTKLDKFYHMGRTTRWDKKINGSREAAIYFLKYFN